MALDPGSRGPTTAHHSRTPWMNPTIPPALSHSSSRPSQAKLQVFWPINIFVRLPIPFTSRCISFDERDVLILDHSNFFSRFQSPNWLGIMFSEGNWDFRVYASMWLPRVVVFAFQRCDMTKTLLGYADCLEPPQSYGKPLNL